MNRLLNVTRSLLMLALLMVGVAGGTKVATASIQTQQSTPVDVMLVIDGSFSIAPVDFELARTFAKQLVASCILGTDAQVGAIQFSNQGTTRTESRLSKNARAVNIALDRMVQLGANTDIQDGLKAAQNEIEARGRSNAKHFIVLLTDGEQTEPGDPVAEATNIKAAGSQIFAVGVGFASTSTLSAIASDPDATYLYSVGNFSELASVLQKLLDVSCGVKAIPASNSIVSDPAGNSQKSAEVYVVVKPTPNTTATRDATTTFVVEAHNRGKGSAKNTVITMPLNKNSATLISFTSSRPAMWVSEVRDDALIMQTGKLASGGDVVSATVTMKVTPSVAADTALGARLTYWFSDANKNGRGASNLPILAAGGTNENRELYAMQIAPASGPAGSEHTFSGAIFVPKEPVAFWYNTPDGKVVGVKTLWADENGVTNLVFKTSGLAPGRYTMVGRGEWSTFNAMGTFVVQ